jgi:hypothetical protein
VEEKAIHPLTGSRAFWGRASSFHSLNFNFNRPGPWKKKSLIERYVMEIFPAIIKEGFKIDNRGDQ